MTGLQTLRRVIEHGAEQSLNSLAMGVKPAVAGKAARLVFAATALARRVVRLWER
ncbi:hypothetical protein [Chromobacterium aquaticum]|uniref:Uncharacterized protein n=1 Tax=Chromobacterium aquaticum TaxID=467180 RepID=A0ABV8ZTT9_9NEIS|nr:hypothetical protein [Chromobacterium aquaticum]MCD5362425.1 hypothetical protein [Chromobacterium aquaticum]